MAPGGSTNLGDVEDPEDRASVKQEQPDATLPQDLWSLYALAAPGQVAAGPSAAATQDEDQSASPLLPTHEADVALPPSESHPGPARGNDEVTGTGGQVFPSFAALPNAPPQAQAGMTGVPAFYGNDAGQRELPGLARTRPRGRRRVPGGQAQHNPYPTAPVNRGANPPSPSATLPQRPVQQGHGAAGPSRVVYPGNLLAGAAYPAGPWGPQALAGFVNNAGMGFGHTPQGPTYPGAWGHQAFANPPQRALVPYRGVPQRHFLAGPSRAPGYPMQAAAQFTNAAAMAPQAPGAGSYAPPLASPAAAPPPGLQQNLAPPVQLQPNPAAAVAQAGPSHVAPPAAAPQVPPVDHPTGRGGFECVHCPARFAQYARCSEHVITAHIIPEFIRKMGEVATMIHAVPDADA